MLTCYGHEVRLPQNDLAYVAFRIGLQVTLVDIEANRDLGEEPVGPVGYLSAVPFLEQTPLPVQVDLLANVWTRHRTPELIEASLLDAAVFYAACVTTAEQIECMPDVAEAFVEGGPREISPRVIKEAPAKLDKLFDDFWDDRDFLLIEEFQDLAPERSRVIRKVLRLPDEMIEPLYEALGRARASPNVARNLAGLMTPDETRETLPLLQCR